MTQRVNNVVSKILLFRESGELNCENMII